jgi:hypothetical protein
MFRYIIDFKHADAGYKERLYNLSTARDWCWDTWGPSSEIGLVYARGNRPHYWGWFTEHRHLRLYLRSEEELTLFQLKF